MMMRIRRGRRQMKKPKGSNSGLWDHLARCTISSSIRGSTAWIAEFLELAGRLIPLDNHTRWNSWYKMLLVAIALRAAIEKYCQNHESDLEEDELTPEDWRWLHTIKEFLEPFNWATLYTEGDSAAIDRVLFTMDILIKHFQISLVSRTPF